MHGRRRVVRRSVDRVEVGRRVPHIGEVVPRPGGNHDHVARSDIGLLACDIGPNCAVDEGEHLVVVLMDLRPDLLPGPQGHHNQLDVAGGVQDAPEGAVVAGGGCDVNLVHPAFLPGTQAG